MLYSRTKLFTLDSLVLSQDICWFTSGERQSTGHPIITDAGQGSDPTLRRSPELVNIWLALRYGSLQPALWTEIRAMLLELVTSHDCSLFNSRYWLVREQREAYAIMLDLLPLVVVVNNMAIGLLLMD